MKIIVRAWYMKPDFFRDGMFGSDSLEVQGKMPRVSNLKDTHVMVREFEAEGLMSAYAEMQGEVWSPNGEVHGLIESLGLGHTSMSVGDVIEGTDRLWMVDVRGFKELER